MSDEMILAILGAIAAIGTMAGNLAVTWRSKIATQDATRAVAANTEATTSNRRVASEVSAKADANYKMLSEFMVEFRKQASTDRDASLERAIGNVWKTRERVLLARHEEMMELLHHIMTQLAGGTPRPLSTPAREAHDVTDLPPLQSDPESNAPDR